MQDHAGDEKLRAQDISSLSDGELLVWNARLKSQMTDIQSQIENWNADLAPAGMDGEWRDRAQRALGIQRVLLVKVKLEQTQRAVAAKASPPGTRADAFVKAAMLLLGKEKCGEIWELAATTHPGAFGKE